ncbi:DUF2797 domain-containing protein [Candidatus Shikimatogenerans silvanidophilus]|uniref:DUF2797 domain-containing protein n=1 Tax=Candidatus Shikimatogenerans silvanidophilus TaxID=2782547 RepID=UPI001BAD5336|nr:DUF2797 domain-containing protein [Candidatus Shikimatogenerans silvanidophilus]
MINKKKKISLKLKKKFKPYFIKKNKIFTFNYPINLNLNEKNEQKIKYIYLKKEKKINKKLIGIKGQYLIFNDGYVFNIRNHEGYIIKMKIY